VLSSLVPSSLWSLLACRAWRIRLAPEAERLSGVADVPSAAQRRRLAVVAGHSDDEVAARAGLRDRSPDVRASALGAIARMGALRLGDIAIALADPASDVRRRSCYLAGRYKVVAATGLLVAALSDAGALVVVAACDALGALGEAGSMADDASVVATTALALTAGSHRDPLCREEAVAALGAIGSTDGLPAVLAAMADKPAVRRRATLALAGFEGVQVEAALARALADADWQVRQAAEDLLGRHSIAGEQFR